MYSLRPFIERILAKREAHKPRLEAVQQTLDEFKQHLRALRKLAEEAQTSDDAPSGLKQHVGVLLSGLNELESRISDCTARAANLLSRFSQGTINIGVAGKARQGKSTLLQAISGLDDRVIPTSEGLPCTGAKSRILHRTDDQYAEIEFYTHEEFLREIIHAYYEELGFPGAPTTLDDFEQHLPPKPDLQQMPEKHALYEKLRELHAGIREYRPYLSHPPQQVNLDEVREYVSQEEGRKRYLAVRCASIYVTFPNVDVTGLALVDLPGLGEIAKGHSEKLVTSLQREIDAIVLIRLPSDRGDYWSRDDIKVFNEIKKAVPELDLADWLFVVLNIKRDKSNMLQVELLRKNPPDIGSKPRLLAVNCLDPEDVRQHVFLEVLKHLEQNLESIDQRRLTALQDQLSRLAQETRELLQPLASYFEKDQIGIGDYQKFRELFRAFRKQLRTNLDDLTEEYRRIVHTRSMQQELGKAIDDACDDAKNNVPIPTVAQLKDRFHDLGGWKAVITEKLHHLRSYLTNRLADILDQRLTQLVEDVRQKIMHRLISDSLSHLLPKEGAQSSGPDQQLKAFCQLLTRQDEPTLLAGLNYLLSFSFSYKSHFHHRVRDAMNPLDPMAFRDEGEEDPVSAIAPPKDSADRAEDVQRGLRAVYERVVWRVRQQLHQEMEQDPMKAIFSMVEETRDRLARAEGVEQEWEHLLYPRRADIWPKEFNRFAVASARRQQWRQSIENTQACAGRLSTALT